MQRTPGKAGDAFQLLELCNHDCILVDQVRVVFALQIWLNPVLLQTLPHPCANLSAAAVAFALANPVRIAALRMRSYQDISDPVIIQHDVEGFERPPRFQPLAMHSHHSPPKGSRHALIVVNITALTQLVQACRPSLAAVKHPC
ncbi:hypothetical protein D3C75_822470 [compost metagenome]